MIGRRFTILAFAAAIGSALLCPGPARGAEIEAITKPSVDVTLSFVRSGRVAEVLVKEGEIVKAGALLARQDDEAERIQLSQLEAMAADTTKIETGEAELAQKRADLQRFEKAQQQGAATDTETEHSRLSVKTGEISVRAAKFEHEQNRLKRDEIRSQIERFRLVSPVNGRVEEVVIETGESAQALAPVIRVVAVDPLWIDAPVPLSQARQLKTGQAAMVGSSNPGGRKRVAGRIVNIGAVADAASDTLRVRIEVPNPARRPAGERVGVSF